MDLPTIGLRAHSLGDRTWIFGSVFGFILYLSVIKNIGANDAAYIAIIMTLIALIISTIFEGLAWDLNLYVGAILVLFGNILILKRN